MSNSPQQPVQLKIRVYKKHLALTANWYMEQLAQKHGPYALNEAKREIMRREFEVMQASKRKAEKTNSWQVPLQLVFHDNGLYEVDLLDPNRVLFLD